MPKVVENLNFSGITYLAAFLTSPFVLVIQIYKTHFFIFKMKLDLCVHWALFLVAEDYQNLSSLLPNYFN